MKKLLVIFLVLAFVAPAMAADNFSIKGQYYVTGWDNENFQDGDDADDTDHEQYWTQRFRVQPQIKVADGVTANLRMDFAETHWGGQQMQATRPGLTTGTITDSAGDTLTGATNANDIIQVDRAYVDITKGIVNIKAGLQFFSVGQAQVFRDNEPGFLFTIKTPVTIGLGYIKRDEGGSLNDEDGLGDDVDRYVIKVDYKSDAFSVGGFYVMQKDDATVANEPMVYGVHGSGNVGPVAVKGELALFGGDNGAGVDYVGTQLNVEGVMKMSDALSLAVELIYSDGTDKVDEMKVAYIGDPFARKSLATGGAIFGDYYDGNWKPSSGTPLGTYDVFDPMGGGTGALGGGLGVQFKPMEDLTLTAYFHYLTASEDIAGEFEKGLLYQAVISYMLAPKTMLQAAYLAVDAELKDATDPDTAKAMWLNLTVNF